jgi:hypothetical protein
LQVAEHDAAVQEAEAAVAAAEAEASAVVLEQQQAECEAMPEGESKDAAAKVVEKHAEANEKAQRWAKTKAAVVAAAQEPLSPPRCFEV